MAAKTAQAIYEEIVAHIGKQGFPYNHWYAGITADIDTRLFGSHNVSREKGTWIYRQAADNSSARAVEAALHRLGCQGAGGGGDDDSVFVYAYFITNSTVE